MGIGLVVAAVVGRLFVKKSDVEALARMIASENPNDGELIQTAVAWVAKNEAKRLKRSVTQLLVPDGAAYGPQGQGGRWYASTRNEATEATRAIARNVLSGATVDPTNGATNFDSPRSQRAGIRKGLPGYKSTPEEIAQRRMNAGQEMVTLPGVDPDYMRFWRYV